jgi:hypothetical protein
MLLTHHTAPRYSDLRGLSIAKEARCRSGMSWRRSAGNFAHGLVGAVHGTRRPYDERNHL